MSLTIIEGPDCSGKTTLMRDGYPASGGWVHEHCGPPGISGPWQQYSQALLHWWKMPSLQVVYDRFLYGELVYGPLLRPDRWNFGRAHVRMLERVMLSMEAVVVCAMIDQATSKQLWRERQVEELIQKEQLFDAAFAGFERLFLDQLMGLPRCYYDFQHTRLNTFLKSVEMARPVMNQGPGIGHWCPGVTLMVGEQINPRAAVCTDWPFVAEGGSSLWLAERLEEAKINESQFYWINASNLHGQLTDAEFVSKLRPSRIVALGAKANLWCQRNKLDCIPLQHPQYWKRFRDGEVYPLLDALSQPQRDLFQG